MLIVSYDIQNTKLRTKFSRFLKKFGHRLQFSVYEVKNSKRVLDLVISKIKLEFEPMFTEVDSIIVLVFNDRCEKHFFGYAKHEDEDLIIIGG